VAETCEAGDTPRACTVNQRSNGHRSRYGPNEDVSRVLRSHEGIRGGFRLVDGGVAPLWAHTAKRILQQDGSQFAKYAGPRWSSCIDVDSAQDVHGCEATGDNEMTSSAFSPYFWVAFTLSCLRWTLQPGHLILTLLHPSMLSNHGYRLKGHMSIPGSMPGMTASLVGTYKPAMTSKREPCVSGLSPLGRLIARHLP